MFSTTATTTATTLTTNKRDLPARPLSTLIILILAVSAAGVPSMVTLSVYMKPVVLVKQSPIVLASLAKTERSLVSGVVMSGLAYWYKTFTSKTYCALGSLSLTAVYEQNTKIRKCIVSFDEKCINNQHE